LRHAYGKLNGKHILLFCYASHIRYNSCTSPLPQASPVFDLLLFCSTKLSSIIYEVSVCNSSWMLITPSWFRPKPWHV